MSKTWTAYHFYIDPPTVDEWGEEVELATIMSQTDEKAWDILKANYPFIAEEQVTLSHKEEVELFKKEPNTRKVELAERGNHNEES